MLTNYKSKEHLICTLEPSLIKSGMTRRAAKWLLRNIKIVKEETLKLIDYLVQNKVDHEDEYLNLSQVTNIGTVLELFVDMY